MNIILYTHEAFARFILYSIMFGIASFVIYCIINVVVSVPAICRCKNITLLKACIHDLSENRAKDRWLLDFLCLLVIAIFLLSVSFIANRGEFRIVSLPLLFVGFSLGRLLFERIIIVAMSAFFFLINKFAVLIFAPVLILIRALSRMIKHIAAMAIKRCTMAQIAKYTNQRFKDLDRIKHTGLIEQLFEVV